MMLRRLDGDSTGVVTEDHASVVAQLCDGIRLTMVRTLITVEEFQAATIGGSIRHA